MFNFFISACLLEGYDKGGYDLGMLSGVKSAADCRVLCQKRKECLSFVATEYQQCFLKNADLEKTGGSINNNIGVTLGSKFLALGSLPKRSRKCEFLALKSPIHAWLWYQMHKNGLVLYHSQEDHCVIPISCTFSWNILLVLIMSTH